ncbi:hypothetical protein EMCRGX_G000929 [Ephydatia muelleri]
MASKSTSGTIEWNYENIEQLIELYEQRPCFYDTKSKDYFNRDVRSVALQDIAKVLNTTASIRTKLLQLAISPAPNEAPALIGGKLPENCDAEAKI